VVLLDTCSLLDVVRQPTRTNIPSGTITAALTIAQRTRTNPRGAWIIASDLILEEWATRAQNISKDVEVQISKIERDVDQVLAAARLLPTVTQPPRLSLTGLRLHDELHDIAAQVLACAEILKGEPNEILNAHRRLVNGLAPAKKGKQEYKDCVIIEQYLSFCRDLRAGGLTTHCIFVTSNINDYGTPQGLLPPRDMEFAAVGLEFALNFDAALSPIK